MAIYNIFDYSEKEMEEKLACEGPGLKIDPNAFKTNQIAGDFQKESAKSGIFSALAARFFFFLLLLADIVWLAYSVVAVLIKAVLHLATFTLIASLKRSLERSFLSFKLDFST